MVDDDRMEGSARNMKGKVKEGLGKLTGDAKLEGEGKGDQAAGKIQNAVGGIKDAFREGSRDADRDSRKR